MPQAIPGAAPAIAPCLWFDTQAEAAATYYTAIFPDSRTGRISHYGKEGFEVHGRPEGSVMTVEFWLGGRPFLALNGGPQFPFSEAISFQVPCADQAEIDHYWERLGDGGQPGPCGWLKDRFGVSWQVFPAALPDMLADPDPQRAARTMRAMLSMEKFDITALEAAADGRN